MPAWCAIQDIDELLDYIRVPEDVRETDATIMNIFPGHPFGKASLNFVKDLAKIIGLLPLESENDTEETHFHSAAD